MLAFLLGLWTKTKLWLAALAGVFSAIAVAYELGHHKGTVTGETKVAAKAAQTALQEALEASKIETNTQSMAPGEAQRKGAAEWARSESDAKL
jgi:hypothetical protein